MAVAYKEETPINLQLTVLEASTLLTLLYRAITVGNTNNNASNYGASRLFAIGKALHDIGIPYDYTVYFKERGWAGSHAIAVYDT